MYWRYLNLCIWGIKKCYYEASSLQGVESQSKYTKIDFSLSSPISVEFRYIKHSLMSMLRAGYIWLIKIKEWHKLKLYGYITNKMPRFMNIRYYQDNFREILKSQRVYIVMGRLHLLRKRLLYVSVTCLEESSYRRVIEMIVGEKGLALSNIGIQICFLDYRSIIEYETKIKKKINNRNNLSIN